MFGQHGEPAGFLEVGVIAVVRAKEVLFADGFGVIEGVARGGAAGGVVGVVGGFEVAGGFVEEGRAHAWGMDVRGSAGGRQCL